MLTFKLIFERENSNYKAECNEMFDLYVDGTKIEISRISSDLNVPLIQSDHLSIADQMIPPLGREHSHGKTQYIPGKQVLVRS